MKSERDTVREALIRVLQSGHVPAMWRDDIRTMIKDIKRGKPVTRQQARSLLNSMALQMDLPMTALEEINRALDSIGGVE